MTHNAKDIRRVVTGKDQNGRSGVLFDSAAPLTHALGRGGRMTDCWVFNNSPAGLSGDRDDGDQEFVFEPPPCGAHFRFVDSAPPPESSERASAETSAKVQTVSFDASSTGDRGGSSATRTRNHKTESVDYGVVVEGRRTLVLDDRELLMEKGDVVIQLGNFHAWDNDNDGSIMSFIMIGGTFGG